MVSSQATQATYGEFLRHLKTQVLQRAKLIASGATDFSNAFTSEQREELIRNAEDMVDKGFWMPLCAMIDGCDAERLAFEANFPGILIRVCQFHMIRACQQYFKKVYASSGSQLAPGRAQSALQALRKLQRCPAEEEWDTYYTKFRQRVRRITDNNNHWLEIHAYLHKEWLSPRWRKAACDYGLPTSRGRDWGINTNNHAEAMFKTFDVRFLNCRKNKR